MAGAHGHRIRHHRHQDKSDTTTRRFYEYIIVLHAPQAQERKVTISTITPGLTFSRRMGSTNYKVKVHFDPNATDTMEDKIMRMIRNECLESDDSCGIIDPLLMSRQSERSA